MCVFIYLFIYYYYYYYYYVIVHGGVNRAVMTIASLVLVAAFWGGLLNQRYLF